MKRLNFEFSDDRIEELKQLQAETRADSMKELFNTALAMLEWSIKEVKTGNEIAAVNEEARVYRVFITPLLERVVKNNNKKQQAAPAPANVGQYA